MLGIRRHRGIAIDLYQGDITTFVCDAMVNAANEALQGGGGVDGAIHQAGGPEILAACRAIGHCATGDAVITTAGNLPCQKVIHAVGPVWQGGKAGEAALLSSCFHQSLQLAASHELRHVAFSAISTGIYGYPLPEAAAVSMSSIKGYIDTFGGKGLRRVTVVLFSLAHYQAFQEALYKTFPET